MSAHYLTLARPRLTSDSEILDAAQVEFMQHGNRATTAAIAERAGISEAGLLKRFGTKDQLLVGAMGQFLRNHAAFPALPAAPLSKANLVQFASGVLHFFRQIVPVSVMVHAHLCAGGGKAPFSGHAPVPLLFRARVSECLTAGVSRGEIHVDNPQVLAAALTGTLWQAAFFEHIFGDTELLGAGEAKFLSQLIDTIWHGVAPKRQPAKTRLAKTRPSVTQPAKTQPAKTQPAKTELSKIQQPSQLQLSLGRSKARKASRSAPKQRKSES